MSLLLLLSLLTSTHTSTTHVRILPGHCNIPDSKKYLFLFRGAHGGFRLADVKAAAATLGVPADSIHLEAATCESSSESQPILNSYGGDIGPEGLPESKKRPPGSHMLVVSSS